MRAREFQLSNIFEQLDEVRMSPKAFADFIQGPEAQGILVGFEFEMCVYGAALEGEEEYDWDTDQNAWSFTQIRDFFASGRSGVNDGPTARRLANKLENEYEEWLKDQWPEWERKFRASGSWKVYVENYIANEYGEEAAERYANGLLDSDNPMVSAAEGNAYSIMKDDFIESDNQSIRTWLYSVNMPTMKEIYLNNSDLIEWPYMTTDPMAGIEWAAENFSTETKYPTRASPGYHVASRERAQEQGQWIVEEDGSIMCKTDSDLGLEFISPPMTLKQGMIALKKVQDWGQENAYTNQSTGLHINISVPGFLRRNLDYVKLTLFLGDEYVLKTFNRMHNDFARSAMKNLRTRISDLNANVIKDTLDHYIRGLYTAASQSIQLAYTDKYTSINVKDGYVEFRGPGNDYLNMDLSDLTNTTARMAMALKIASDPEAHKQEYLKKLYSLISKVTGPAQSQQQNKLNELLAKYVSSANDPKQRETVMQTVKSLLYRKRTGQPEPKKYKIFNDYRGENIIQYFMAKSDEEAEQYLKQFRDRTGYVGPLFVRPADWKI